MGKKARRIIGVVAAIAVPYLAPKIAATVFASTAINATVASALTGAALGAGAAAIGGTDIAQGALMGGISGGIAGYMQPTAAAPAAPAAPVADTYGALSTTPALTPGATYDAFGNVIPATTITPTFAGMEYGYGASGYGFPEAAGTASFGGAPPAVADISTQLSGVRLGGDPYVDAMQSASAYTAPSAVTPTTTGGFTYDAMGNVVPAGSIDPTTGASVGTSIAGVQPSANLVSTPDIVPATAAATTAAAKPTTFSEAIKQVPGEIADKFKDPKALANLTLLAAGQLAGAAFAGDGMSREERQLLEAERADLERLRTENESLFRERLAAAQNLMGESKYFDPEYFGLQSARRAQLAGARSRKAGLRGLRGRQKDVAARQYDIETARTTGTAYDVGAQTGLTGRLQTQQAGLSMMPTSFPSVSYAGLRGAYDSAAQRRSQQQSDIGRLFGSLTS
jgi:hypothetical protein